MKDKPLILDLLSGPFEVRRPRMPGEEHALSPVSYERQIMDALKAAVRLQPIAIWDLLFSLARVGSFTNDGAVAEEIMASLHRGALILARPGAGDESDADRPLLTALKAFRSYFGREFHIGVRKHRLVFRQAADELRRKGEYDVVPAGQAAQMVLDLARNTPTLAAHGVVLAESVVDLTSPAKHAGLVLLRAPVANAARYVAAEDVVTPAKLKELVAKRLRDPRWLGKEPMGSREDIISTASIDDTVFVRVTTAQFPIGTPITFVITDAATREVVATLGGRVGDGETETMAHAQWCVPEALESGPVVPEKTKFLIAAEAMGQKVDGAELKIVPWVWELLVQFDPEDPKAADDELILLDSAHAEVERVGPGQMTKEGEDWMRVKFKKARKMKNYTLIRDHGEDEGGGIDVLLQNESPFELERLADEQKAGA